MVSLENGHRFGAGWLCSPLCIFLLDKQEALHGLALCMGQELAPYHGELQAGSEEPGELG